MTLFLVGLLFVGAMLVWFTVAIAASLILGRILASMSDENTTPKPGERREPIGTSRPAG